MKFSACRMLICEEHAYPINEKVAICLGCKNDYNWHFKKTNYKILTLAILLLIALILIAFGVLRSDDQIIVKA